MAEKTLQAIDAAKTYLFAGPQLEELLLEVAGAASTAAGLREGDVEVAAGDFERAIVVAINLWALDRPERFALAHQRADDLGVPKGLLETSVNALLDLILIPAEEVPLTPEGKVERGEKIVAAARLLRDLTPQRGGAAAPDPGPVETFAGGAPPHEAVYGRLSVGDAVEIEGHHEHKLPPILEARPLPIHGRIVEFVPDTFLVWVEIDDDEGDGEPLGKVRLHRDQIEQAKN